MDLSYRLPLPQRKDYRIGCIGSGFIMRDCHLPAYRKYGFQPVAIASRDPEHAKVAAQKNGVPRVHASVESLLDDPSIEVLDIAVRPDRQLSLIQAACQRGTAKAILAQKPLGMNYAEACAAVSACEKAGITLAVNQNMRFDPSVLAGKRLLQSGLLGDPVIANIDMRALPHWMPWQKEMGWVTLRIMSIHHLDTFRFWFGNPERIFCSTRPDPRTDFPHTDGICAYILEYANGLRCMSLDDTWTGPAKEGGPSDLRIQWRMEGLNGLAIGDVGWCKDPYTSPSSLRWATSESPRFHEEEWKESWFPDAFAGTMGELLCSLEENREPMISGNDNLSTMALVEAAYQSAREHRAVELCEIFQS